MIRHVINLLGKLQHIFKEGKKKGLSSVPTTPSDQQQALEEELLTSVLNGLYLIRVFVKFFIENLSSKELSLQLSTEEERKRKERKTENQTPLSEEKEVLVPNGDQGFREEHNEKKEQTTVEGKEKQSEHSPEGENHYNQHSSPSDESLIVPPASKSLTWQSVVTSLLCTH